MYQVASPAAVLMLAIVHANLLLWDAKYILFHNYVTMCYFLGRDVYVCAHLHWPSKVSDELADFSMVVIRW